MPLIIVCIHNIQGFIQSSIVLACFVYWLIVFAGFCLAGGYVCRVLQLAMVCLTGPWTLTQSCSLATTTDCGAQR